MKKNVKESILDGTAIGSDATFGIACVIEYLADTSKMTEGNVLVADITDPDWVPAMTIRGLERRRRYVECDDRSSCNTN